MGYQFVHVNTYSRTASKGSGAGWSAQDVADEAERKPSACHHVKNPQPPILLFGVMPSQAVRLAEKWAAQYKDAMGRKLRADGLCLVAGVVSVPANFEEWDRYKQSAVDYLIEKYGDRLLSVVEHVDEENPHVHYYVVPLDGERMEDVHEGLKARNQARDEKKPTGIQNELYKRAMEFFQTDFWEKVSSKFGLAKDGPKRERKPRAVYLVEREAGKILADANIEVQQMLLDAMSNTQATQAEQEIYKASVKASAEAYIARETARGQRLIDTANSKAGAIEAKAAKIGEAKGKAKAEAKWGGVAGVVAVVKETLTGREAELLGKVDKKDLLAAHYHNAAHDERRKAEAAKKIADEAEKRMHAEIDKTKKLEADIRKIMAEKAEVDKKLYAIEHPQQRQQQQRQDNAPAPKM